MANVLTSSFRLKNSISDFGHSFLICQTMINKVNQNMSTPICQCHAYAIRISAAYSYICQYIQHTTNTQISHAGQRHTTTDMAVVSLYQNGVEVVRPSI